MSQAQVLQCAKRAKAASYAAAGLTAKRKNKLLLAMARLLIKKREAILKSNRQDLLAAKKQNLPPAWIDRLTLNRKRIAGMSASLKALARLPDPVGKIAEKWRTKSGLQVERVRIPLGVIGIIYESRPDVTVDTAAICMKAGNAVILRGGKEAYFSNRCLSNLFRGVLRKENIHPDIIQLFPSRDRGDVVHLLSQSQYIDLMIPRGGEGLMRRVERLSKIPVIKHDKGVCHIFVDRDADLKLAHKIVMNAKTQRPSTCNALECLLVDQTIAKRFLPNLLKDLKGQGIKINRRDWGKEFLGPEVAVRVVKDMEVAMKHIERYGSLHTEAIVTQNPKRGETFLKRVLASAVMVNASTRLNDGFALGLGAEVGISTTKLHAFGPMGLEALTTTKYVVQGSGQIRK